MSINEIIQEILDEQIKLEKREEFFKKIYPESFHDLEYETKKYHRAREHGKNLFKKFLKKINNKYFIIKEKHYNNKFTFFIGRMIDSKFSYLNTRDMIWKDSSLNFGFPPEHTYVSWYKSEGPDAKINRFKIHGKGWSVNLENLFNSSNEYFQFLTFDDEESMLLYYEMMRGE